MVNGIILGHKRKNELKRISGKSKEFLPLGLLLGYRYGY